MSNDKATTRPWKYQATSSDYGEIQGAAGMYLPLAENVGREDAELIVRAVNAHDALVAALKDMVRELSAIDAEGGMGDYTDQLRNARAALKLAKGE